MDVRTNSMRIIPGPEHMFSLWGVVGGIGRMPVNILGWVLVYWVEPWYSGLGPGTLGWILVHWVASRYTALVLVHCGGSWYSLRSHNTVRGAILGTATANCESCRKY